MNQHNKKNMKNKSRKDKKQFKEWRTKFLLSQFESCMKDIKFEEPVECDCYKTWSMAKGLTSFHTCGKRTESLLDLVR